MKYQNFLKYVESTILDHVKEKIIYTWTDDAINLKILGLLKLKHLMLHRGID